MSDTKGKQDLYYRGLCIFCLLVCCRQLQPWVNLDKIKLKEKLVVLTPLMAVVLKRYQITPMNIQKSNT